MEMIFNLTQIKLTFTRKVELLGLIMKVRVFGTQKWPIHLILFLKEETGCSSENEIKIQGLLKFNYSKISI